MLFRSYYVKPSASDVGKKAFIVNRVGDFGFILGTLLIFSLFGTLDFQEVAVKAAAWPVETGFGLVTIATLLLFVGATGKSAQRWAVNPAAFMVQGLDAGKLASLLEAGKQTKQSLD